MYIEQICSTSRFSHRAAQNAEGLGLCQSQSWGSWSCSPSSTWWFSTGGSTGRMLFRRSLMASIRAPTPCLRLLPWSPPAAAPSGSGATSYNHTDTNKTRLNGRQIRWRTSCTSCIHWWQWYRVLTTGPRNNTKTASISSCSCVWKAGKSLVCI